MTRRAPGLRALAVALLAALPAVARAHIVSDREVQVLRALPEALVAAERAAAPLDSTGAAGPNRGGWRAIAYQTPALTVLADAAARGDTAAAEAAWRAIDLAFVAQRPGGGFVASTAPHDSVADAASMAPWLAELDRAIAVVMNSPLKARFQFRWALLRPKLERSLNALERASPELERRYATDALVMLTLAQAFLMADGHYHRPEFGAAGQRCLSAALAAQGKDGRFPSDAGGHGAPELEAQSRGLLVLETLSLYFPAPFLGRASERLAGWLEPRTRSLPTGLAARAREYRHARLALPPPAGGTFHAPNER